MVKSSMALDGKVALVTGAAGGIGRAGALSFAAAGAAVMVADINVAGAAETVALVEAAGGTAAFFEVDLTEESQVEGLLVSTLAQFGGLDCAFNNAGYGQGRVPLHETTIERWRNVLDANLTATFLCIKHEVLHMLGNGGGSIVNVSSGAARIPAPGNPAYSAAKRGVVALTTHTAHDYARNGIRANAILPGIIDTEAVQASMGERLTKMDAVLPMGVGQPADIADVAVWLCTDAARYINGQALVVDGGGILA